MLPTFGLLAVLTVFCVAVKEWLTSTGILVATVAGIVWGVVFTFAL